MDLLAGVVGAVIPNLGATLTDPLVWRSLAVALLLGAVLLVVGTAIARRVGVLAADAPDGEVLAVGLAIGILVVVTGIATLASGGRSSFTPLLVAFIAAVLIAIPRSAALPAGVASPTRVPRRWFPIGATAAFVAAGLLVAIALLFALTMAPSAQAGTQPVEFMDEAFYSILGRDILASGTEQFYSPSGFGTPAGFPDQNWYHWGELWLAGGVDRLFSVTSSFARHLVVLPLLLVAATALVGSVVRRGAGTDSRAVFVFGCAAGLLLAPVPLIPGNYFTGWASGGLFSITMYGLAVVEIPLLMLFVLRGSRIPITHPATLLFVGTAAAIVLPSHVAIALLALAGSAVAIVFELVQQRLESGRWPRPGRDVVVVAGTILGLLVVTFAWGTATGHRVVGSGSSPLISPFNEVWRGAIVATVVGAITMLTIPVAWLLVRRSQRDLAGLLIGSMAIVCGGALAWGVRLAEFTMFHVYFGAIVVFATPMAATAVIIVRDRLQHRGFRLAAVALVAVAVLQVELGVVSSGIRFTQFSPRDYDPIPGEVMDGIRALEPDARIGYACLQQEEIAYWDARLLSIDMHTGRRIIPLCYEADLLAPVLGADETTLMSPQFVNAPQSALFPTAEARPTPAEVTAWMRRAGIGYLFVDSKHPNTLVPDAIPIVVSGSTQLLRLP